MVIGIIFIAIWLVAAIVAGGIVGGQNRPVSIGQSNITGEDCNAACRQWEARRLETCQAKSQTASFQARVDASLRGLRDAVIAHLALVAAAVAAAFIPIIGQAIAIVIGAAALVALSVVHMYEGQLIAQSAALGQAQRIERDAIAREEAARLNVLASCTPEEAMKCLSQSAPC